MDRGLCIYCHLAPITGRKQKYCDQHSHLASMIWKRRNRRVYKATGDRYWLDDWKGKRAYFREYMRKYRKRTTTRGRDVATTARP
jgi:hypothetical protein